jgi:hypothetical protein
MSSSLIVAKIVSTISTSCSDMPGQHPTRDALSLRRAHQRRAPVGRCSPPAQARRGGECLLQTLKERHEHRARIISEPYPRAGLPVVLLRLAI